MGISLLIFMQCMIDFWVNSYLNMPHMLWVILCEPKYIYANQIAEKRKI